MPKISKYDDPDWQPTKLSEVTYFTQQFIPLDTNLYHPTVNGVETVVYKDFVKTDYPPMNELYFNKQKAEAKSERLKKNIEDEEETEDDTDE